MFRTFIVLLEIVVLVMVLRSPFVQYFFSDIQQSLTDWMTNLSMMEEKHKLEELRDAIAPYTSDMREYQKDYVLGITDNKESLKSFHRQYCVDGDKNPYIYGVNLRYICAAIQRSPLLST